MLYVLLISCSEYALNEKEESNGGAVEEPAVETVTEIEDPECDPLTFPGIQISIDESCTIPPEIGVFSPVLEWHWQDNTIHPGFHQVMAQPIVISLTDDNFDGIVDDNDVPDIIFSSFSGGAYTSTGTLSAISGDDGSMLWSTRTSDGVSPFSSSGLAAANVDGVSPYIYATTNAGLGCFDSNGLLLWSTQLSAYPGNGIAQPAIADLEGDGIPEVILGPNVLNALDGTLLWTGTAGTGWNLSFAVDLDDDGIQEVIAGNTVYEADGTIRWTSGGDGHAAVADLDLDGIPEIVVREHQNQSLRAMDINGNVLWTHTVQDNGGGPLTIADYDADGYPEIGMSGELYYRVVEHDGTPKWSNSIIDASSRQTGSSVFDFEGDGRAEVVYADEEVLWVFDGETGSVEMEWTSHSSGTLFEYPVIVDIDKDGSAEIVAAANDYSSHNDSHGIVVIGDEFSSWNAGVPVWNQHAFYLTNIEDDGTLPLHPTPNWYEFNNFRSGDLQARDGDTQADVYPSIILVCTDECYANRMTFLVAIGNSGTKDLEEDILIELYGVRSDGSRLLLDIQNHTTGLQSGAQSEGIEFEVTFPQNEDIVDVVVVVDSFGFIDECNETNNETYWGNALCP